MNTYIRIHIYHIHTYEYVHIYIYMYAYIYDTGCATTNTYISDSVLSKTAIFPNKEGRKHEISNESAWGSFAASLRPSSQTKRQGNMRFPTNLHGDRRSAR